MTEYTLETVEQIADTDIETLNKAEMELVSAIETLKANLYRFDPDFVPNPEETRERNVNTQYAMTRLNIVLARVKQKQRAYYYDELD